MIGRRLGASAATADPQRRQRTRIYPSLRIVCWLSFRAVFAAAQIGEFAGNFTYYTLSSVGLATFMRRNLDGAASIEACPHSPKKPAECTTKRS
jgi:hypothetical protein